jgi:hypothetical protein
MRAGLAAAIVALGLLSLAPGGAAVAFHLPESPLARYLVRRADIPRMNPDTLFVVRVRTRALRAVYGQSVAHWMRSHGVVSAAAEDPQFTEPGVARPFTGEAQAAVAVLRSKVDATGAAARYLAFNRAVSDSRHRPPLGVPHVPTASLLVVYGRHTGGTVSHPAAAVVIWTEGRCMVSVSVGGDTAKARESFTRYAERVLYRVERRTHGRCPAGH